MTLKYKQDAKITAGPFTTERIEKLKFGNPEKVKPWLKKIKIN